METCFLQQKELLLLHIPSHKGVKRQTHHRTSEKRKIMLVFKIIWYSTVMHGKIYLLGSMLEIELLTHQEKISSVAWTTVPAESTYTNIRYLLEFNIELHKRTCTLPQSMKLTLPIRFKKKKKLKSYKSGRLHAIKQLFWIFDWIHFST